VPGVPEKKADGAKEETIALAGCHTVCMNGPINGDPSTGSKASHGREQKRIKYCATLCNVRCIPHSTRFESLIPFHLGGALLEAKITSVNQAPRDRSFERVWVDSSRFGHCCIGWSGRNGNGSVSKRWWAVGG